MDIASASARLKAATIVVLRDPFTGLLWLVALCLVAIACSLRVAAFDSSVDATALPFLTLAAILVVGIAADRVGLFRWIARVAVPDGTRPEVAVAGVLAVTALVSGLINLDVAVVVAVPLALAISSSRHLSAPWLVMGVALTANATSFLLPTSNITNLLVLGTSLRSFSAYVGSTWLAWLLVTILTVVLLTIVIRQRSNGYPYVRPDNRVSFRMIVDLAPLFIIAVAVRMVLGTNLVLHGGFFNQLAVGSVLAASVNNLPAAAAIHAAGGATLWAAILAMAIGPNLLLTGSLATVISRRIARDGGAYFSAWRFSMLGLVFTPLQLMAAMVGLKITGAL
jgi:arsenical pump membrane protein